MADFNLKIVSPRGQVFEGDVESLVVPGEQGSLGVLAGHAPMIAALQPGVLTITHAGSASHYSVGPGLLEIDEGGVVVLADEAFAFDTEAEAREKAADLRNQVADG